MIYPEDVKNILTENITFIVPDVTGKCQGGDFILKVIYIYTYYIYICIYIYIYIYIRLEVGKNNN